ncbi:SDR family NAD(P)-dependent oxidoreductase [Thalassotalea mangrovi]|uniref:SDR family NAD(P)-dependent oxidoreductase n=1 Tax=Thalassotalea mangrovi TaxID=2572245 RepID=UPI001FE77128|nr:SDR family NAD(P)-dependent oxidoreductase [Thalassotalea mangrovi]
MSSTLIIGASSAIANAIANHVADQDCSQTLIRISRSALPKLSSATPSSLQLIDRQCDYGENAIASCCEEILASVQHLDYIFICNGVLHGHYQRHGKLHEFAPEKKLEDVSIDNLEHVIRSNAVIPLLWLQHLLPLFARNHPCKVVCFSARVGSIQDNRLGGWYSYRASKAMLNMLLKTTSIEFARRFKQVKLIAFHPGTTDSDLSKPFQANVPEGKLFSPDFVAQQLFNIVKTATFDQQLSYLDWDNQSIDF